MINVGVAGAAGKMGKTLIQAIAEADEFRLTAAIERAGSSVLGRDSGELAGLGRNGVKITDNVESACDTFSILIDFTIAKATVENLQDHRIAMNAFILAITLLASSPQFIFDSFLSIFFA